MSLNPQQLALVNQLLRGIVNGLTPDNLDKEFKYWIPNDDMDFVITPDIKPVLIDIVDIINKDIYDEN